MLAYGINVLVMNLPMNPINNFGKYVKFDTDWVDALLNTLRALYNIFHNGLIHKSLNHIWASLGMVMFQVEVNN